MTASNDSVTTRHIFNTTNGVITQNTTITSDWINLNEIKSEGFFALDIIQTGAGTVDYKYKMSSRPDPVAGNFNTPDGANDIKTGLTAGSLYIGFADVPPGTYMLITATETNVGAALADVIWVTQ